MMIEREAPPGWKVWEIDSYLICIPHPDDRPHGFRQENGEHIISDEHALLCECNPSVAIGRGSFLYDKPIVQHNSFHDIDEIAEIKRQMDLKEQ